MLTDLVIENIAVIERAEISFTRGFNCMTGETGAGKSVIIDSINAVMGEKTSRDLIRTGESRAFVSASFSGISAHAARALEAEGVAPEADGSLVISRTLFKDGRNNCRINGTPATLSMLRSVAPYLINIHGQADSQQLMDPDRHLGILDSVADDEELIAQYTELFTRLRELRRRIRRLETSERERAERADLLRFQTDEIEKSGITPGELDTLRERREIIKNSKKLIESLSRAYTALSGSDDEPGGAELLLDASGSLSAAAQVMPDARKTADALSEYAYSVRETMNDINALIGSVAFSPEEMEETEERIDLLQGVLAKYGGSEESALEYYDSAVKELSELDNSDELAGTLAAEYDELLYKAADVAEELSSVRHAAAERFSERIMAELDFLDMKDTRFAVDMRDTDLTKTGMDAAEFMLSANKGEAMKPLAKTASGGELSRIMLAVKSVLADRDDTDTLIFDEIDTGVGGRAAVKIAKKLADVSVHRQVICITHIASIAAFADNHLNIKKSVSGEKTYTAVTALDRDGRIRELAGMTGGSEAEQIHFRSAEKLIDEADAYKVRR